MIKIVVLARLVPDLVEELLILNESEIFGVLEG